MDQLFASLLQMGVGGAMAGAVIWFLRYILTVVVPRMTEEHRLSLKEQQQTFREILRDQNAAASEQQGVFESAVKEIVTRLEAINQNAMQVASRLEALDRHVKANQDHLGQVRDWLLRKQGKEGYASEHPPG